MGCEAGGLGQSWTVEGGMLPIDRCWAWRSMLVSQKGHPGASRKRNWTGKDGAREPRQKAGAGSPGSRSVGMEEGAL